MQNPSLKFMLAVVVSSLFVSSLFASSAEISLNSSTFKLQGDWSLGNNGLALEGSILHLAIGGKVIYVPAQYNRVKATAEVWFAPDVLAFDKLDKYQEIALSIGYNVIRDADVFLGYRNLKAGFKSLGDGTLDTGFHAGIRVKF